MEADTLSPSLADRVGAYCVDIGLMALPMLLVATARWGVPGLLPGSMTNWAMAAGLGALLVNQMLNVVRAQSVGMRVYHLRWVGANGELLPRPRALLRVLAWTLLAAMLGRVAERDIAGAVLAIYFLVGFLSRGCRTLHDRLAGAGMAGEFDPANLQVQAYGDGEHVHCFKPCGWQEASQAPRLLTLDGIGSRICGAARLEKSGRVRYGTLYFAVFFVPVLALRRYIYARRENQYQFFAQAPVTWGQTLYNLWVGPQVLAMVCIVLYRFSAWLRMP